MRKNAIPQLASAAIIVAGVLTAAAAGAQIRSPLSAEPSRESALLKKQPALDRATLALPGAASITVKQIETTPGEFPPVTATQYKVGYECTIKPPKPQTSYGQFPRYRCQLDQARTSVLNGMKIHRLDNFPSVDGITTKVILVTEKSAINPKPGRIRSAFQLYFDKSDSDGATVLKDFVYADALLAAK